MISSRGQTGPVARVEANRRRDQRSSKASSWPSLAGGARAGAIGPKVEQEADAGVHKGADRQYNLALRRGRYRRALHRRDLVPGGAGGGGGEACRPGPHDDLAPKLVLIGEILTAFLDGNRGAASTAHREVRSLHCERHAAAPFRGSSSDLLHLSASPGRSLLRRIFPDRGHGGRSALITGDPPRRVRCEPGR